MAEGTERIAGLSQTKRELLERRLSGRFAPVAAPVIPRRQARAVPITRRQQGIWISQQLHGRTPLWNLSDAFRLAGPLDANLLRRALEVSFRRHDVLRSRIGRGTVPELELVEGLELPFRAIDLIGREAREAERLALELAAGEAATPFDLHEPPLLRITLVRIALDLHLLVLVVHHIVGDGWSLGVLMGEVEKTYAALTEGRTPDLAPPAIQFSDYAAWLQSGAGVPAGEARARVERMCDDLAGAPPLVTFPTDFARPPVFSIEGGTHRFLIPPGTARGLAELARELKVSQFTVALTAFDVLLARLSGQTDVVVGSSVANRRHAEIEPLIGMFVNTVVYRTDLSGDPTFVQAVGRVNGVAVRALANQETPFEDVLAALEVARDLSFQPVFQVMFIYQNWPFPVSALGAARLGRVGIHSGTAKHDLHFVLEERDGALEVCIEYATALYRAATIERFAQHFAVLLDGIVADPERRISDLPLLTSQQQQQIVAWNSTATAFPRERCLHELFAEQAARTPDAVAVACEGVSLTYAELDVRGNRLAHHLRALGVGPEVVVGLCMERSAELLVALLGILKTGGAYLPLDPAYPPERLAYMLADADVPVLVTHAALAERFPAGGATLVRLDAEAAAIASRPAQPVASGARPENLAYVIYTSGSTGRPKGVMIPHGALVNFLCSMAVEPGLGRTDVVAATTPLSFDIAGLELYLPLLCGARSVIVPRAVALDTERLCAHLAELGTTALQATPSLWRLLLESGWQPGPGLKLLCGGEALPAEVAARLAAAPGGAWNLYGPTETTIWSAACRLLPGTGVSIGRPIANTQLYVLDAALQPVPVGVAGEICIGGAGLARGYFGRPGLTAERFVPSPFALGERLYRTGDVARWQPDGTIEFLGRADHQVKLRGHRVELGEIETVLAQIGGVEQAVVTAREAKSGDMRLVAYVVGANLPGASSLRAALRDLLPDHMIPSAFVALPVLPLTPNGKVDRKLLPEPVEAARAPFAAPRQAVPAEAELAALWAEVLGTERVGIDDNFFELGGHSLLLLRVHGKLAGSLGRSLPVSALFQYPTIRALAAHLAGAGEQSDPLGASQVRAAARKAALDRRRRPQPAAQAAEEEISSHV